MLLEDKAEITIDCRGKVWVVVRGGDGEDRRKESG